MRFLKEIVQIIRQFNPRMSYSFQATNGQLDKSSNIQLFYEGLLNDKFDDDDAAAQAFYNAPPTDPRYKKLKNKVRKRIINTLFLVDLNQPSFTDYERAYYACCKDWAAAKILFRKEAREAGIHICHRVHRIALKYEFTELVIDTARILRLHYGERGGDIKRYEGYNELFKEHEHIWQMENLAEEHYTSLVIYYVNSKSYKQEIHEQASRLFAELAPALQQYETAKLHMIGNLIQVIACMSVNDYTTTINVCRRAIDFFEAKPFTYKTALNVFLYQKLVCLTQLREYDEGKRIAEKSLKLLEAGTFNWFKCQELYFTLSLHTGNYQQALQIYDQVQRNKRFSFLPLNIQEIWTIYEAYLYYLVEVEQMEFTQSKVKLKKFRLGKFLNEVPIFSKDKRGLNIPILVIQILFLISRKKYDEAIDRIEAIEKYCSRYLRKNETFRSNCFIKMLLQIPISSFHKAGVKRRAQPYYDKLLEAPLEIAQQVHEIEIIPYEDLWQMALKSLDLKFHRSGSTY
ncbi:MAG: hypothetical protein KDC44_08570 [Phaeodactylibacter sp.]|nr:hypothetical protein [Phaeodactylibacter sp.]